MKFILGKKIGMSQIYGKDENVIPVTVIEAGPSFITQIKTKDKDGYSAIQIGFEKLKDKKIKRPQKDRPYRYLREFSIFPPTGEAGNSQFSKENPPSLKIGDKITVDIFKEGDVVKISGTSKGRGFQGVVKRHGFKGGPASHGHRHVLRRPGSIGSSFPERVVKGKKMPGHMGVERVTVSNLKIAKIDLENNLLAVTGAVPGANGGLVEISSQ